MDIRPIDANALDDQLGVSDRDIYVKDCLNEQPTITLNTLRDAIYEDAVAHGLWEDYHIGFSGDLLEECHSMLEGEVDELCDAIEDWVNGHGNERFTEELADVVIMCFSVAGKLGIDIDTAIRRKMEINKKRPWKHGKVE